MKFEARTLRSRTLTYIVVPAALLIACAAVSMKASFGDEHIASFQGVGLGESAAQLRVQLGKPKMEGTNEHATFWSYKIDNSDAWRVAIIRENHVVAVYIRQAYGRISHLGDGHGLSFGNSITNMFSKRGKAEPLVYTTYAYLGSSGVYWLYEITQGKISAIGITRSYDFPLPAGATYDSRDGGNPDRAVLLLRTDGTAEQAEHRFALRQSCDYEGRWKIVRKQSLKLDLRRYDRVLMECSTTGFRHNFFFDTTDAVDSRNLIHNF